MSPRALLFVVPWVLVACGQDRAVYGSCGDNEVMARFPTCAAAMTQASCVQAGGTWGIVGLGIDPTCSCPTGQEGCPCKEDDHCLGACLTEMSFNSKDPCAGVSEGTCTGTSPTVGCWCWFDSDGEVSGICAD